MAIQFPVEYMDNRLIDSTLTLLREVRFPNLWWRNSALLDKLIVRNKISDRQMIELVIPKEQYEQWSPDELIERIERGFGVKPKKEPIKMGKWEVKDGLESNSV